ncbi:GNAT family N-acetyltransferase [Alteromonas portus]|uniref:GNAT family N-acetyltransferase n=1 Tax=Alteromonas portus TaxID=2565549 RepID=UPI003BF8E57A
MALTQLREWLLAPYCENSSNATSPLHRRMLVISGNDDFCEAELCHIHSFANEVSSISVANFSGSTLKGKKRQQVLGSECDLAILDCRDFFKPGDVMAVAGIVKRSGCLILVCPNFNDWIKSVSVAFISEGFALSHSRYLTRFIEGLRKNAYVAFHTETNTVLPDLATYRIDKVETQHTFEGGKFKAAEQQDAYKRMYQAFSKNQLNALITAPRGRGKSSLLGIFIDRLVSEGKNVLLTSEQVSNVTNIMARLSQNKDVVTPIPSLIESAVDKQKQAPAAHQVTSLGSVKWVPPDSELLYCNKKTYDLTVVDEAASLPLPVVSRIMANNSQWVLSTTLLGYEGSGSGFIHKLIPSLPDTIEQLALTTPLRWFENDPIEIFLNKTCLFNDDFVNNILGVSPSGKSEACSIASMAIEDSNELIKTASFEIGSFERINERTLQCVMSLLSLAHYQTTPDDFMRLLDSTDVLVSTLKINDIVIAAAIINIEGGKNLGPLSRDIASGQRRPKGHLGAQRLTLLSADPTAATHSYWRINRIAVHPQLQAKGMGSYLIQKIKEVTHEHAIDALCTSYGTTVKLDKFWSSNGFNIVDYGRKPNKASGETSALAVLPLTRRTSELVSNLIALNTSFGDTTRLNELPHYVLSNYVNKLFHFTQGTRPLDDVWPILNKLAREVQTVSNTSHHNNDKENDSYLNSKQGEVVSIVNRLVKVIEEQAYLEALFKRSELEMKCVKAILKDYGLRVTGLKETTALIRTRLQPAFDALKKPV